MRAGGDDARALAAYERASALDPQNPLYAGRLLGHRARLGHPIAQGFGERMRHLQITGDVIGAGFFAEAALKGLVAARRFDECRRIARRWRGFMSANPHPIQTFRHRAWMRAS